MRFFLIIALFACAVSAGPRKGKRDPTIEEVEEAYNIIFDNPKDEAEAAKALEKAEEAMDENADNPKSTFVEKIYPESLLTIDEFESEKEGSVNPSGEGETRAMGSINPPADRSWDTASNSYFASLSGSPPASWDSRTLGIISPVKNQEQCGSCVSFASTAVIEACLMEASGRSDTPNLAEQYLVDCGYDPENGGNGCNGAWPHAYLDYIVNRDTGEMTHEYADPYKNDQPSLTCAGKPEDFHAGAKVANRYFSYAVESDNKLKQIIKEHGIVLSSVFASAPQFMNYGGGVINEACNTANASNHAITLLGWGKESNGDEYWIGKNSWGTGWGEDGFFRIKMGICKIGQNVVAITCVSEGTSDEQPTTQGPPPSATCDLSGLSWFGTRSGNYNLNYGGKLSEVSCTDGICKARNTNPDNCCMYICGKTTC